jgi:hypothetical protein
VVNDSYLYHECWTVNINAVMYFKFFVG